MAEEAGGCPGRSGRKRQVYTGSGICSYSISFVGAFINLQFSSKRKNDLPCNPVSARSVLQLDDDVGDHDVKKINEMSSTLGKDLVLARMSPSTQGRKGTSGRRRPGCISKP